MLLIINSSVPSVSLRRTMPSSGIRSVPVINYAWLAGLESFSIALTCSDWLSCCALHHKTQTLRLLGLKIQVNPKLPGTREVLAG
jgi:hypothetical protein